MSVPTAVFGSKPKIRISIGVIRLPPPMPVMPTRIPTAAPAITYCQVTAAARFGALQTGTWFAEPGSSRARSGDRAADERLAAHEAAQLVGLAAGAEAGDRREQRERGDQQGEDHADHRRTGGVRDRGSAEEDDADDVREARRAGVLERALAEARLDQLEVREARQAEAAAERQANEELQREQRQQPPPARRDRDNRHDADQRLVRA